MNTTTTNINRVLINAPIEVVWNTLVKTDEALPFFFGAVCETKDGMRAGANYRMVSANRKVAMVVGEVLRFEPPHVYAHTFTMTNIDEPPVTVTYSLTEKDGGTEFELRIDDLVPGSKLAKEMVSSQGFIASNLKSLCERGKPAFTGRMVGVLGPVFARLAKKSQAVENWPL
ncbi:SRPBCC domain-containing protein [Yoonia sp. 2307UL14-13]|uniref:SRPBCC domain-containing protein n=1 Tax=Yoonia sp. 2307UL14-13 TaxID=3126506 RepID=UPI0030B6947A